MQKVYKCQKTQNSKLGGLSNYNTLKFHVSSLLQGDGFINLGEPNSNGNFKMKDEKSINNFEHWIRRLW